MNATNAHRPLNKNPTKPEVTMSKNNNSTRSLEHQALISEIYLKLIPYIMKRGASKIELNNSNSCPWESTDIYMKSMTVISNRLTISPNEAKAKSAIKNKLSKLGTDGRHELVASFIINKMIPWIDSNPDVVLTWEKNKGTISRMFENDLIDQYRHANTNQAQFEASHQMLDVSDWEQINSTTATEEPMSTINFDELHDCYEAFRATLGPADRMVFSCAMIPEKDLNRNAFIRQCCEQLGVCRATFYKRLSFLKDQATAYRRARVAGDI